MVISLTFPHKLVQDLTPNSWLKESADKDSYRVKQQIATDNH